MAFGDDGVAPKSSAVQDHHLTVIKFSSDQVSDEVAAICLLVAQVLEPALNIDIEVATDLIHLLVELSGVLFDVRFDLGIGWNVNCDWHFLDS